MSGLADYAIQRRLGQGGMAEIFLAHKRGMQGFQKPVVLKRILPHLAEDPAWVEMFLDEARIAAGLNHPHIPQIFELGAERGEYFIVMEYIEGHDLDTILARHETRGTWPTIGQALTVVLGVAEALEYAHGRRGPDGKRIGLVHRDVSPHNIMISVEGAVKLIDFGIAKSKQKVVQTDEGSFKGKMEYAAPEQVEGEEVDRRADLWSLGAVLFELLYQRAAYPQKGIVPRMTAMKSGTWRDEIPPEALAQTAPALMSVLEHCLAPRREDRYPRARDVIKALHRHLDDIRARVPAIELGRAVRELFVDGTEAHVAPESYATMSAQGEPVAGSYSTMGHPVRAPFEDALGTQKLRPPGRTQVDADPIHSMATELAEDESDLTTGPSRGAIPALYGLHSFPDEQTDPRNLTPWDEQTGFLPEPNPVADADAMRTRALPVRPRRAPPQPEKEADHDGDEGKDPKSE